MSRFRQVTGILQEGSLYVLLFLLPFSKAAIEITFVLLLLGWVMERLDPATRSGTIWLRPSLRPVALAIGGYLGVCALSIAVSSYPSLSLRAFFSKWLEYLMFFVIVADLGHRPGVVRRSALVIACSSLFVVIEGVTQEVFGQGIFRGYPLVVFARMTGPYENPIDLATYLMVIIPFLLVYAVTRRTGERRLLWGVLFLLMVCLGRTLALGVWVAFGVVAVAVLIAGHAAVRQSTLMLTGVTVLSAGFFLHHTGHLREILTLSDIGTADRRVMWQAAIGMIRDRPLLGHGLNTFMANYLDYWVGGERQPRYAHNCYLQVWAETGIVGLVLFVALLGLLFARLIAGLRRSRSDNEHLMLVGFLAGLVAFAVHAGVDTNFYSLRQAALFWVFSGLALGWSERFAAERQIGR